MTETRLDGRQTVCMVPDCDGYHVPNLPLLRKILDQIRHDPASWYQGDWASIYTRGTGVPIYDEAHDYVYKDAQVLEEPCKTAFCIAGHAAMLSDDPLRSEMKTINGVQIPRYDEYTISGLTANERAKHELGLTHEEAHHLFYGANTWDDIKFHATDIAAVVGETL